jgi:hypothetical protein
MLAGPKMNPRATPAGAAKTVPESQNHGDWRDAESLFQQPARAVLDLLYRKGRGSGVRRGQDTKKTPTDSWKGTASAVP